jgi:hypothetical protein
MSGRFLHFAEPGRAIILQHALFAIALSMPMKSIIYSDAPPAIGLPAIDDVSATAAVDSRI